MTNPDDFDPDELLAHLAKHPEVYARMRGEPTPPQTWFGGDGLHVAQLADFITETLPVRRDRGEALWTYNGGVWRPDGKPRCRAVLTLQTDERTDEQDDGVRRLAVPMHGKHLDRLSTALKTAGVADLADGQAFAARWTSGVGVAGDPRIIDYHVAPAPTPAANTDHDVEPHDLEATEPAHATHHDAPAF